MKRYSTTELRKLEIVNLCDGARLGYASDFEFEVDCECGRLLSLVICGGGGFLGFGKKDDIVIPWRLIERIGEDVILVKMTPQELSGCVCPGKPRKKHF